MSDKHSDAKTPGLIDRELAFWIGQQRVMHEESPCRNDPVIRKFIGKLVLWEAQVRAALAPGNAGAVAADDAAKILDHKWLDPECVEKGCQSLVWKGRYESAVKGRQEFRQAYREARTPAPSALDPVTVEALRELLPRYVSWWAREMANEALDDIEDESAEGRTYYLARWFDAIRAISHPAPGNAGAVEADEEFVQAIEVQTDYERGWADGRADLRGLVDEVLARTIEAELENERLRDAAPASNPQEGVLRKALKEIEKLGEKSYADGSNAIRMGNIAHAALIEAGPATSTHRASDELLMRVCRTIKFVLDTDEELSQLAVDELALALSDAEEKLGPVSSNERAKTKCECGKPDNVSCYNPDCARPA